MKRYAIVCLMATVLPALAAAYSVKGTVNGPEGEGEAYATVRVFLLPDTVKPAKLGVTDDAGRFDLQLASAGTYSASVTAVGRKPLAKSFKLTAQSPDYDLGALQLADNAKELGEVEVTARRPVIQADGDRVAYNLDEDPQSSTSTVMEMLRKVPLVTVDAQDNIKVNGQSSFKILLNGKENPMLQANAKMVFKAMPASAVKKIEVITEPGAKYDAEGAGGILNIITESKQSPTDGYMATLRASVSNNDTGAGVYGIGQIGNVTSSLSYNYHRSLTGRKNYGDLHTDFLNPDGSISSILDRDFTVTNNHNFNNGAFDLSWEPDSMNLFNLTANLWLGTGRSPDTTAQWCYDNLDNLLWSYSANRVTKWQFGSVSASASYQHTFGREGHNIVLSYLYNHGFGSDKSSAWYYDVVNYPLLFPSQVNDTNSPTNEHTVQIDYTNPFTKKHKLETGVKMIFRRNASRSATSQGVSPDNLVVDESSRIDMSQFQDVEAVYGSYTGTFGKWTAKGGLRYEHTRMGVDFRLGSVPDYSVNLDDVVPNAAIGYRITPASSLRLAYQMRITRPSVSQLNPYHDNSSPLSVRFGNPDLKSERNNSLTLTYSNFTPVVGMNVNLGYSRNDNPISRYSYLKGAVTYETYANIGCSQTASLNAYINWNISQKLQLAFYGGADYVDFSYSRLGLKNSGWGGYAMANLTWTLPADFRTTVHGGYGANSPDLQTSSSSYYYYSLSLSKSLLKEKRLELSLSASNFFGPLHMNMESWTAGSRTSMHFRIPMWNVGFSVSYRIGSLGKNVKKVSTQIVNYDVENSSSKGASSGTSIPSTGH